MVDEEPPTIPKQVKGDATPPPNLSLLWLERLTFWVIPCDIMGPEVVLFKTSVCPGSCLGQKPPKTAVAIKNTAEAVSSLLFYPGKSIAISSLGSEIKLQIMFLSKGQQTESVLVYICTGRRDRLSRSF